MQAMATTRMVLRLIVSAVTWSLIRRYKFADGASSGRSELEPGVAYRRPYQCELGAPKRAHVTGGGEIRSRLCESNSVAKETCTAMWLRSLRSFRSLMTHKRH